MSLTLSAARRAAFDDMAQRLVSWWVAADTYGDGLDEAQIRRGLRQLRLPSLLGAGSERVVLSVPEGALKIGVPRRNRAEAQIWEEAPDAIRRHLLPVLALAEDGRWLLMEKGRAGGDVPREVYLDLDAYGLQDVTPHNISRDGRLLDYGTRVAPRPRTERMTALSPLEKYRLLKKAQTEHPRQYRQNVEPLFLRHEEIFLAALAEGTPDVVRAVESRWAQWEIRKPDDARQDDTLDQLLQQVESYPKAFRAFHTWLRTDSIPPEEARDYIGDWLNQEHGIGVREDGLVTFDCDTDTTRKIIGDLLVVVYHHTATGALKRIREEGLLPWRETARRRRANPHQNSGAGVYVTTETSGAAVEGYRRSAERVHRGSGVTLTIRTTLEELEQDPDDADLASVACRQFVLPRVAVEDIIEGLE